MNPPMSLPLPLSAEHALTLRAGDEVELNGWALTGRDQACARLFQMITEEQPLPIDLAGQLIYFVGPSPARPGGVIGSAGPTTAGRMNAFMPALLASGVRGFLGKGYLGDVVKQSLRQHGGVYFGAIGGTGALLSQSIEAAEVVAFPELLSEAMYRMKFLRFPAVVLYDSQGGDLYVQAMKAAH